MSHESKSSHLNFTLIKTESTVSTNIYNVDLMNSHKYSFEHFKKGHLRRLRNYVKENELIIETAKDGQDGSSQLDKMGHNLFCRKFIQEQLPLYAYSLAQQYESGVNETSEKSDEDTKTEEQSEGSSELSEILYGDEYEF